MKRRSITVLSLLGMTITMLSLFAVLLVHSRKQAILYLAPIKQYLVYHSWTFAPVGTDAKSPSFVFLFFPRDCQDHHLTFYVETGLHGTVKSFTGPFVNSSDSVDFAVVRTNLIQSLNRKSGSKSEHSPQGESSL